MKKMILALTILFPTIIKAEGIDEKINEKFMPIADWWEGLILTRFGSPDGLDDDGVAFRWNHGRIQRNAAHD